MNEVNKMIKARYNAVKPHFRSGDTLNVYIHMINKGKQVEKKISGTCIRVTKSSFLIRNKNNENDIEYNFSLLMPTRVEVEKCGRVRQGRIYYWRNYYGKKAKIRTDFRRESKRIAMNQQNAVAPTAC